MAVLPRRTGIASVATLSGITLSLGLTHLLAPGWCRAVGLDVWNFAAAEAEYRRHAGRGEELDDFQRRLRVQIEVSESLAADLAAGRRSLAEAADEMARVNTGRPGFEDGMESAYPDIPVLRHRVARYAIDKGRRRLGAADPSAWAAAQARLEAEYRALTGE